MKPSPSVPVAFVPAFTGRAPGAVAAWGEAGRALLDRCLSAPDPTLSGVAGSGVVVLLGPEASLPWVEGAVYLASGEGRAGVYLPTTWTTSVPEALAAAAVRRKVGSAGLPAAWIPAEVAGRALLVPLGAARPLGAAELLAAREAWR